MKYNMIWSDQVPERDGAKSPINDIAISRDGTRVVVAVGNRVLLYNGENGDLIESLRGHKDTVYSVDFCFDGTRFASGGADNIVVIWKSTGQGMLKYNHTASIQRVAYNPSTLQLASCSEVDFGLWIPDQKQVTKEKVASKITAAAWASDGSMLALGMQNGLISLRNAQADEIHRIERRAPIWCMLFIPNTGGSSSSTSKSAAPANGVPESETLVVGCWDKTLSLYKMQGASHRVQTERKLSFYPCGLTLAGQQNSKASYMIVSGSNKKAILYSRDGLPLTDIITKDSWIWSVSCHTGTDSVAIGSDDGSIDVLKMSFDAVHALYKDRYAYRENLTEVVVQHLVTDRKVRIKCRDLIQKLSLYKNKLAVQLSDKVCIYESDPEDTLDLHFRLKKERVPCDIPCDMMVIVSCNVLFCLNHFLHLYSFDGQRLRTWTMDKDIKYVKANGGPEGKESILIGLSSGQVLKVIIDNPFPFELTKRDTQIVCADLSLRRDKVAVVDTSKILTVIDIKTQDILFNMSGVFSACFNSEVDDMLCYTAESSIFVMSGIGNNNTTKSDNNKSRINEPVEQQIAGLAIGFHGQRIYCLYKAAIIALDVPQGTNIQLLLEVGDVEAAYKVACLGATESDWRLLGMRALRSNSLIIAKNAFSRLKDTKFMSLIDMIERSDKGGKAPEAAASTTGTGDRRNRNQAQATVPPVTSKPSLDPSWQAEILAYEGQHHEAAKTYARAGKVEEAIRLFVDLRRWNDAKMFSQNRDQSSSNNNGSSNSSNGGNTSSEQNSLTMQQAKWLQEVNDWRGASEILVSLGQHMSAARVIVDAKEKERDENSGWQNLLLEVVRAVPKDQIDVLNYCGEVLSNANEDILAREAYAKLGDVSKLMALYVRKQMFAEAAKLAEDHEGKFDLSVFLPYAEWLVLQDRYEDAIQAFKKAARNDLARQVLEELTFNAVVESRYKDAAYFYWLLSREVNADQENLRKEYERKADLYFSYSNVHSYVTDPFTTQLPETLFQVSRFIINTLGGSDNIPYGISKASTLYTLARQSMALGAYKLARQTYDRLSQLQTPGRKQEEIEHDMLVVQAKPVRDEPEHLPVCYRCGSTNPLLNPFTNKFSLGDVCTNCGHPFVRSFVNFDILPLVEFVPEPSISDEEAVELMRSPSSGAGGNRNNKGRGSSNIGPGGAGSGGNIARKGLSGGGGGGGGIGREAGWKEAKVGESDMMTMDDDPNSNDLDFDQYDPNSSMNMGGRGGSSNTMGFNNSMDEGADLFTMRLNRALESQSSAMQYVPIVVDVDTLLSLKRSEIFICKPNTKGGRTLFYRNMLPDIAIAVSQPCHRFFHLEDFEFAYLSNGSCPYSRIKDVGEYGSL